MRTSVHLVICPYAYLSCLSFLQPRVLQQIIIELLCTLRVAWCFSSINISIKNNKSFTAVYEDCQYMKSPDPYLHLAQVAHDISWIIVAVLFLSTETVHMVKLNTLKITFCTNGQMQCVQAIETLLNEPMQWDRNPYMSRNTTIAFLLLRSQ